MTEARGVFTLDRLRIRAKKGTWVTPEQAFTSNPLGNDAGYFAGGTEPGYVTKIDKTTYSTDSTARIPATNLSEARSAAGATGSTTAGYIGGGFFSPPTTRHSRMDKLTYSTETLAYTPGANLSIGRNSVSATGNDFAGYFGGGFSPALVSTMDKVTFSNDTTGAVPGAALSTASRSVSATGNQLSGYFSGGTTPGGVRSTTDKLTYSTDTTAAVPGAALSGTRYISSATGNSTDGYVAGGYSGAYVSTMDKITYSTDTTAAVPGAALSVPRYGVGAAGNQSSGYFAGGVPGPISTTDKTTYSSDTTAAVPGAALSSVRQLTVGTSSRSNALPTASTPQNLKSKASFGYGLIGGGPLSGKTTYYRIDYSTDVAANAGNLTFNAGSKAAGGGTQNEAYVIQTTSCDKIPYATLTAVAVPSVGGHPSIYYGGQVSSENALYAIGGSGSTSNMIKLTYATETSENLPAKLALGATWPQCFSNLSAGYAVGRDTTNIQKVSFVTETCNLLTQKSASSTGQSPGGSGFDAGYTIQGTPSGTTVVGKLTYATETHGDIPRMFTQTAMSEGGTTGHGGAGYYMMGYTAPTSYVTYTTKTNYVTETSSRVPGANSTFANRDCFDTSSQDFNFPQPRPETPTLNSSIPGSVNNGGYHCGGYNDTSTHKSEVMKIDFATDNVARVPGANLSGSRYRQTATASNAAGYNAGGRISGGSRITTMDKTTLSSETTSAVPGAVLTQATYGAAAGSCSTHGYFAGGAPGGTYRSRVDKLTFSSDTTAASPNNLPANSFLGDSSVSSPGFAYQGGGVTSSPISSFTKINFSTDTVTTVPSAVLSASKYGQAAMGNTREGYFFGGNPSQISIGDRLTFSTETVQRTANYPLSPGVYEASASGNQSAGYVFGGANPAPDNISYVYKFTYDTETFDIIGGTGDTQGNAVSAGFAAREGGASHTSNVL